MLMSVWIPTDFKSVSLTSEKFDENLEIGRSKTVKNCDGKIVDPKLQSLETISATKRFHFRQKAPSPRSGNVSFAWRYNTRGCHTMNTEKVLYFLILFSIRLKHPFSSKSNTDAPPREICKRTLY